MDDFKQQTINQLLDGAKVTTCEPCNTDTKGNLYINWDGKLRNRDIADELKQQGYPENITCQVGYKKTQKPLLNRDLDIVKISEATKNGIYNNRTKLKGLESGFYELDEATKGFLKPGELTLLCEPAYGRAQIMLKRIALFVANHFYNTQNPNCVAYLSSGETSPRQLAGEMLGYATGIPQTHLENLSKNNHLSEEQHEQLNWHLNLFEKLPLYLLEGNIYYFHKLLDRLCCNHKQTTGLVIINSTYMETQPHMVGLKEYALENNTAVLCLCQFPEIRQELKMSDIWEIHDASRICDTIILKDTLDFDMWGNTKLEVKRNRTGREATVSIYL